MEPAAFFDYTERFPAEFAASATFADFAASLDASTPGPGRLLQHVATTYPEQWERYYRTIKTHGFVSRSLLLPEARKASDVFADVSLYPYQTGIYRDETAYLLAGAAFVSSTRAKDFVYFGRLGAKYEWSRDWLARGERLGSVSGGVQWLTAAKPTAAVVEAFGPVSVEEWGLSTFEAVQWSDGRTLIIARCNNGFGVQWVAVLDKGETAFSMLGEHERGEIEAERARMLPPVPSNLSWWIVEGEDRQLGAIGIMSPFRTRVKAASAADAKDVAHHQRGAANREHVLCKSAYPEPDGEPA